MLRSDGELANCATYNSKSYTRAESFSLPFRNISVLIIYETNEVEDVLFYGGRSVGQNIIETILF